MQLHPWDPDIETLIGRIKSGSLNLQPDFQRGEVWGLPKRRRLIDTILRGWHVPPVHVVVDHETEQYEVLDGQQRLVAIRDFAHGEITVDGNSTPHDADIYELDGLTYEELPERIRRRFDNYSLRVIRITEYSAEEPGELFFRLNQPTNLTAAEQRNAFYGKARRQVKSLVRSLPEYGITSETVGFTNSRMAYDDVIAKVCYAHHVGSLREKITAGVVTSLYRSDKPFSEQTILRLQSALDLFGAASRLHRNIKYNKATLFSWLIFLSTLQSQSAARIHASSVSGFTVAFEEARVYAKDLRASEHANGAFSAIPFDNQRKLLSLYHDRSTSRVADVASVLTRDAVLWIFFIVFNISKQNEVVLFEHNFSDTLNAAVASLSKLHEDAGGVVEDIVSGPVWGILL
jgi:hypothetical protein